MDGGTAVNFIGQKAKTAADKGYTPYMEMKSSAEMEYMEPLSKTISQPKKNKDDSYGLSLQLGEEYERKKQRLKEELRRDYRRYVAEKKELGAGDLYLQPQVRPVPLKERRSAKEKLWEDRIGDSELILRGQDETKEMKRTAKISQDIVAELNQVGLSKTKRVKSTDGVPGRDHFGSATPIHTLLSPDLQRQRSSPSPERPPFSRRDIGKAVEHVARAPPRQLRRHGEETPEHWDRKPVRQYSSEDELNTEEEQELEILQKRRPRNHPDPGRRERRRYHTANRAVQERRDVDVRTVNEEDYQEENRKTPLSTFKTNLLVQTRAATKKNMTEFATGLIIGVTEEEEATRRRKARYRQELLEQIAEQRKNKRKEKELELRVAATGAIDPEKQPDRIKQFGAVRREYEARRRDPPFRPGLGLDTLKADSDRRTQGERQGPEDGSIPPNRPRVAFQSPVLEYSSALGHLAADPRFGAGAEDGVRLGSGEDFQKDLSGTLGEMVSPRVSYVPPPLAPALSEAYCTPYDDAYYYYGARNTLDPHLNYYQPSVGAEQPLVNLSSGPHTSIRPPPSVLLAQSTSQNGITLSGKTHGTFPLDRRRPSKENSPSYKDALKQQIEERQELRRKEKAEQDRKDAKLEAEMKAYEPWGKAGGGAPLRDDRGNLISDLKRMHRTNEEAYMNPESRGRRDMEPEGHIEALMRTEEKDSSAHIVSGLPYTQPSPYARGNVFSELPTPQQVHEQEKYKESLKQQIEEKRRIEAEKKEHLKLEEEKEEKKLAEQRARIQKEYEEEQEKRKRKEMEQSAKNQEIIRQAEERRKETEKKKKEEEAKDSEVIKQQQYKEERQARLEQDCRSQSPPIPTLQKRLGHTQHPRPPSLDSQRSVAALSASSVSTPRSPPVPARRNQIRATEEQQGVISELSVLRRRLKSEQRRLEGQLLQSEREDAQSPMKPRGHPPLDVFDMARLRMQVPARRPHSITRLVNKQNIEDFNQLKYRDSESREQVRQAYPEPPGDEAGLELQQQALLREQQHRLHTMRRTRVNDYFDLSPLMKPPNLRKQGYSDEAERHSLLQSESAFIDPNGYSFPTTPQPGHRDDLSSARERRRQARRTAFDDGVEGERNSQSLSSANGFHLDRVQEHNQRRMRALDDLSAQGWRSGEISADEGDDLWTRFPTPPSARHVSATTAVTEPWLRPGTAETLKKLMAGHRPPSRGPLNHEWEGPSTYHG